MAAKTLLLPRTAAGLALALCVSLPMAVASVGLWLAGPVRLSALPSFLALSFGSGVALALIYLRVVRARHLSQAHGILLLLILGWALVWGLSFLPAMLLTLPLSWLGLIDGLEGWGQRALPLAEIVRFPRLVGDVGVPVAGLLAVGVLVFSLLLEGPVNRMGRRAGLVSRAALLILALGWGLSSLLAAGNGALRFQEIWVGSDWGRRTLAALPDGGVEIKLCLVDRQPIVGKPISDPDQVALCPQGETADLRSLYTARTAELAGPPLPVPPGSISDGFNTGMVTPGLTRARETGILELRRLIPDPETGEPKLDTKEVEVAALYPQKVGRAEINYVIVNGVAGINPVTERPDANRFLYCFIADDYRCVYIERTAVPPSSGLEGTYTVRADNVVFRDIPQIFGPVYDVILRASGISVQRDTD